ncbi:MAG: GGDEF domain-containing protein, partial [Oscillospiraceae bacterium]|nr:GGDEF domain-containing protein [Oscillospiraceae bacterium]
VSQLLLLFSAFAVVAFPRYGYFAAIGANIFQIVMTALATIRAIQHGGTASALTGLITSVATIILATIIHVFYRRIVKNNEELVNANKILKAKDEKLTYLAYYDILTSLPNRQLFIEKIDETITSSQSFTVIAANIDNFKDINNELGNNAGDAVLCSYSKKLKKLCGNSIFLARINGDEFGFILFGNESETEILNYIDTIKEVISEPIKFNDVKLNITMSYGVAIYPLNATDSTEMLKCVSSALSVAKANGKNTHYFFNNSIRMR